MVFKELIFNFLLWQSVVVYKELIFNSFYFGRVWWSSKNSVLTVSTLGGVLVFKELSFNTFYFGQVWWSSKN